MLLSDPWGKNLEGAPISAQVRRELLKMQSGAADFQPPRTHGDEISRRLDSMTFEQHLMEKFGLSRETVRTFLSPEAAVIWIRRGRAVGLRGLCAGCAASLGSRERRADVSRRKCRSRPPYREIAIPDATPVLTLESISRTPVDFAALDRPGAARIRLRTTVISVQHEAGGVKIVYAREGKLTSVRARSVIVAGGSWTAKHIVKDLPASHRDAYAHLSRALPMANVALATGAFLYKLGISECQWFEGIGNYTAVRKLATFSATCRPRYRPILPLCSPWKILFSNPALAIGEQVSRGRRGTDRNAISRLRKENPRTVQPDVRQSGISCARYCGHHFEPLGHAYLSAQPGFFLARMASPDRTSSAQHALQQQHQLRQFRSRRHYGSPDVNPRSPSRSRSGPAADSLCLSASLNRFAPYLPCPVRVIVDEGESEDRSSIRQSSSSCLRLS